MGLEKWVVVFVRFGMRSGDSGDMAQFGPGGKCWSHYNGRGWSTLLSEVLAAWQRSWPRVGQKIRTRGRLTFPHGILQANLTESTELFSADS